MAETQRFTREEADRLHAVLLTIVEIEPTSEERLLSARLMKIIIQDELDMDEGEVALTAVALKRAGTSIATGDKRALRSLPLLERKFPDLKDLKGRFICLEQIFKRLCQLKGLPRVRLAVLSARHADETITVAYDHFEPQGAGAFVGGMDLVIADRISAAAPEWLKKL